MLINCVVSGLDPKCCFWGLQRNTPRSDRHPVQGISSKNTQNNPPLENKDVVIARFAADCMCFWVGELGSCEDTLRGSDDRTS